MNIEPTIYIGAGAAERLIAFARARGFTRFTLVADERTQAALGAALQASLEQAGLVVCPVILAGPEVVADERALVQVFVRADPHADALLAVGAGTLTDITRFVSDRTRRPFISVPTAPSVDGFTSAGAPLVIDGFKQTIQTTAPVAVFADLPTLCAAPRPMIAAGFGDMLGKYTAGADWQLGALLWGEPYSHVAAARTTQAVQKCLANSAAIWEASPDGIAALMEGLIESGLSIADAGHSRPASGSEHHVSHYWEMKLLAAGRPAILHGAKVGVASLAVADLYRRLRGIKRDEAEARLARAALPDPVQEAAILARAFGRAAAGVAADHQAFLAISEARFAELRRLILQSWDQIQAIAARVPEPDELTGLLRQAGGPTSVAGIGLSDEDLVEGLGYGHYLRNRFTVLKLARFLDLLPRPAVPGVP